MIDFYFNMALHQDQSPQSFNEIFTCFLTRIEKALALDSSIRELQHNDQGRILTALYLDAHRGIGFAIQPRKDGWFTLRYMKDAKSEEIENINSLSFIICSPGETIETVRSFWKKPVIRFQNVA